MSVWLMWLIWSWLGLFGFKTLLFVNLKCSTGYMNVLSVDVQTAAKSSLLLKSDLTECLDSGDAALINRLTLQTIAEQTVCFSGIYRLSLSAASVRPPRLLFCLSGFVTVVVCHTTRRSDAPHEQPEGRLNPSCKYHISYVFFLLSKFLKTNVCVPENGFELTVWIQSQLLHIVLLYAAIVPWWTVTHVQHTCGGKLLVEYLHESMVITIPMTGWEGGENNQSLLRLLPPKLTVSFYKALINVTTSFT